MFKKPSKIPKSSLRKRAVADSSEAITTTTAVNDRPPEKGHGENDHAETNTAYQTVLDNKEAVDNNDNDNDWLEEKQRLERIKKKRKILTNLQYKRGTDAAQLLQSSTSAGVASQAFNGKEEKDDDGDDQTTNNANISASSTVILEQKHRQAMEAFIQQQQQQQHKQNQNQQLPTATENQPEVEPEDEDDNGDGRRPTTTQTEEQLYQELALAAQALAGKAHQQPSDPSTSTNHNNTGTLTTTNETTGEGGAAMLVAAGAGIAEVVLPPSERLASAQATARAAAQRQQHYWQKKKQQQQQSSRPSSVVPNHRFGSAMQYQAGCFTAPSDPKETPASLPPRSTPHLTTGTDTAPAGNSGNDTNNNNNKNDTTVVDDDDDDDRIGFQALRARAHRRHARRTVPAASGTGTTTNRRPAAHQLPQHKKASDDRVYKQFVTRERDKR